MLNMIRRLFNRAINSINVTHGVLPTSADTVAAAALTLTAGAATWTWGAWVEVLSAVGNTAARRITGWSLENFVGAASQGEIQIGTGAGGAEIVKGTYQPVGATKDFPTPLMIPTATRIAARYRTSTGVADTVDIKLNTELGV